HTSKGLLLPTKAHFDRFIASNDRFEHQPPQLSDPIWKAGRDINGEGCLMAPQDRVGPLQGIAIAVVDGDADKTASKVALDQAAMHLVKADEIELAAAQLGQHLVEEIWRDLEQPVWLKLLGPRRPHMMQRQDRANAGHEWPHQLIGAAE